MSRTDHHPVGSQAKLDRRYRRNTRSYDRRPQVTWVKPRVSGIAALLDTDEPARIERVFWQPIDDGSDYPLPMGEDGLIDLDIVAERVDEAFPGMRERFAAALDLLDDPRAGQVLDDEHAGPWASEVHMRECSACAYEYAEMAEPEPIDVEGTWDTEPSDVIWPPEASVGQMCDALGSGWHVTGPSHLPFLGYRQPGPTAHAYRSVADLACEVGCTIGQVLAYLALHDEHATSARSRVALPVARVFARDAVIYGGVEPMLARLSHIATLIADLGDDF